MDTRSDSPALSRLSKALAAAGIASRRKAEELIFAGKVTVNGEMIDKPQHLVSMEKDKISVDGQLIKTAPDKVYFLLHKPHGYICSNQRVGNKKLVTDLFAHLNLRLFTVGRLDRDTTGLLLVTNDGHFGQAVIHPSKNVTKEYLVKTAEEISHDMLVKMSKGCMVDDVFVRPVRVTKVRRGTLKIVVKEGRKREVRRIVEKAGLTLLSLQRIRLGDLKLGDLPEGAYRELSPAEIERLTGQK